MRFSADGATTLPSYRRSPNRRLRDPLFPGLSPAGDFLLSVYVAAWSANVIC